MNTTLLKDIKVKSLNGICVPISEETARKWLYRLGCRSKYISRVECIMMVMIMRMLLNIVKDGLYDG